jgi:8-oxo-dGTP pyrophosphatase MutT (NUDIX family)
MTELSMTTRPCFHPCPDEHGRQVQLAAPSQASNLDKLSDSSASVTFIPHSSCGEHLHGVALAAWTAPNGVTDVWRSLATPAVAEPLYTLPAGKQAAAGAVVLEPDGRIWLVAPSNGFGGYRATFPKGRVDAGASLQATAIKEVWEESGLQVRLTAYLGDFSRTQTYTRFYVARRVGGHPATMGWESQAVHLATVSDAYRLLNRSTDHEVLNALLALVRDS